MSLREVARAARQFAPGELVSAERIETGHIHASWRCTLASDAGRMRLLIQQLNTRVFTAPELMMDNVARVTAHLTRHDTAAALLQARDGRNYWIDGSDGWWRAFTLIEPAATVVRAQTERQARETGRAFGRFHRAMLDYEGPRLHETLPGFHDTPRRLEALRAAAHEAPADRLAAARDEVDLILDHLPRAGLFQDLVARGRITERIAHNDAKIANVLFDGASGAALCVVDLDTVMPGLVLHDFGDMIRSTATLQAEDEPDSVKVRVSLPLFRAIADGFLAEAGGALGESEREHLVDAAQIITLEQAARFLTDYLDGDRYYRVDRPAHNLDRARVQLALLRSLEAQDAELRAIVS